MKGSQLIMRGSFIALKVQSGCYRKIAHLLSNRMLSNDMVAPFLGIGNRVSIPSLEQKGFRG